MKDIYQIASEQRNLLDKKGYNNEQLNFNGMPDTTFTQIFNQLSEGIIKTWPENNPFEFKIDTAGKFEQLPGIVYFKFNFNYDPEKRNITLTGINVQLHTRNIYIKIEKTDNIPHSRDIPDLVTKPIAIQRKYNIKTLANPNRGTRQIRI